MKVLSALCTRIKTGLSTNSFFFFYFSYRASMGYVATGYSICFSTSPANPQTFCPTRQVSIGIMAFSFYLVFADFRWKTAPAVLWCCVAHKDNVKPPTMSQQLSPTLFLVPKTESPGTNPSFLSYFSCFVFFSRLLTLLLLIDTNFLHYNSLMIGSLYIQKKSTRVWRFKITFFNQDQSH